jgi:hypothetical protein
MEQDIREILSQILVEGELDPTMRAFLAEQIALSLELLGYTKTP